MNKEEESPQWLKDLPAQMAHEEEMKEMEQGAKAIERLTNFRPKWLRKLLDQENEK